MGLVASRESKSLPNLAIVIRPQPKKELKTAKERRMWALYLREARESNYQLKRSRKQFAFQIGKFLDQEMERKRRQRVRLQALLRMPLNSRDGYFTLALPNLGKVIGHLEPKPHFRSAAKSLGKTNSHFWRNARLAIHQIIKCLATDPKRFSPFRDGKAQRLQAIGADERARVYRIFHYG